MKSTYPDLDGLAKRWSTVAMQYPRPRVGSLVRIIGRGITGVVVSDFPLVVRDGRGHEYEASAYTVRSVR